MENKLALYATAILLFLIYEIATHYRSFKPYLQQDVSNKVMKDYPLEKRSQVEKALNSYVAPKTKMRILREAKRDIERLHEISKFAASYGIDDLTADKAIQIFKQIESDFHVDKKSQVTTVLWNSYNNGFKEIIHLMILEKSRGNMNKVQELSGLAEEIYSRYLDYRDVIVALNKK